MSEIRQVSTGAVRAAIVERLVASEPASGAAWTIEDLETFASGYADTLFNVLLDIAALVIGEDRVQPPSFSAADTTPTIIDTVQNPVIAELCQLLDLDLRQGERLDPEAPTTLKDDHPAYRAGERAAYIHAMIHFEALMKGGTLLRDDKVRIAIDPLLGRDVTPAPDLNALAAGVEQSAADCGLITFEGLPEVANVPIVGYAGDWRQFLDLAARLPSTILYRQQVVYDPDELLGQVLDEEAPPRRSRTLRTLRTSYGVRERDSEDEDQDESREWLRTRLRERITPWDEHRGAVARVCYLWIHAGVAHVWQRETEWYAACVDALYATAVEADDVDRVMRRERSVEQSKRLQALATQLAQHPRFPEANSETKRIFMAEELFPKEVSDPKLGLAASEIAARAQLIYWWDVEPQERVSKAERVRELYRQGESIRSIAALLKMSEAKVSAALAEQKA